MIPRAQRRLHRFSRPILYKERAHLRKFSRIPNLEKRPYYSKGIFLSQFIEFVRFAGNIGYNFFEVKGLQSDAKVNVARFSVSLGPIFVGKLSIPRERMVAGARRRFHRFSRPILHKERGHLGKFSSRPNLGKCPYYSNVIFCVNLSNSFDLQETWVIRVFEVHGLHSGVKGYVASFSVSLAPIFGGKLGISRGRMVAWARGCFHRFSRPILRKESAHLRKFSSRPNLEKCPYYSNGIFLGQFMEFVRFAGNFGYRGFRGARTRIRCQN